MKKYMLEAFELKRKGYYKQAIEIYYKLLSKVNDDVEILAELADLYYLLKNNERALHYINKTLENEPENISALNVLKKVYISENKLLEAEKTARNIYAITNCETDLMQLIDVLEQQGKYEGIIRCTNNITDKNCLFKRAIAIYQLKQYNDAITVLREIYTDDDSNVSDMEAVLNLACKIYLEQNELRQAKEVLIKLEKTDVKTAEGLNYVGLGKLDELRIDEAVDFLSQAVKKDDKNPNYIYNLGQAYFLKGWMEEAQKCFNTAICLNPAEEKYHYSLAYLYYKCGDYENAEIHLNPEYFDSKVLIQLIKSEKGDLATPKIELEKMLKEHPDNETILYSLAKIYYHLDMYKQAKIMIEKTMDENPRSFEYKTFSIKLSLKLSDLKEAEKNIGYLCDAYPKYYYTHVLEAELYLAQKDYDSLFDTAQDLIELDINHYEGYYYNALALFEKDDINFAIESLKKAILLDVNNADLYVKMSEFYQAIGKYEDAFAYIKEASDIDKSAKNQELYMQLAGIIRRKGINV